MDSDVVAFYHEMGKRLAILEMKEYRKGKRVRKRGKLATSHFRLTLPTIKE